MQNNIIIDGVDVSGCEYYDKNKPSLTCTCEEYSCSECYNCYYKQLKRKEQECEELKKQLQHENQKLNNIKKICNKFIPDHYKILLIINGGIVDK